MKKIIYLIIFLISVGFVLANVQSHPAEQVLNGTFGVGDYVIDGQLNLSGDLVIGTNVNATGDICITNGNCLSTVSADNTTWNQLVANGLYVSTAYTNLTYDSEFQNETIVRSYNDSWINQSGLILNYSAIITGSDNTTWNQLVANGLYADISVSGDNTTWNQLVANGLYADISVTGDNVSWSQLVANDLYVAEGTKLGNTTEEVFTAIDNQTFIKMKYLDNGTILTKANLSQFDADGTDDVLTSYSNVTYDDEADGKYVSTTYTNLTYNLDNLSIVYNYNTSWVTDLVTQDNTTWSQLVANDLYADISVTGDNTTWNQLVANGLYVLDGTKVGNTTAEIREAFAGGDNISIDNGIISINISVGADGTDNESWSQLVANDLYVAEGTKLGNTTAEIQAKVTQDNTTWNQLVANGLYADISVTGDNTTWEQNVANELYLGTTFSNVTYDAEAEGKYVQTSYTNVTYMNKENTGNLTISGNLTINTGKKFCLDGGACTKYMWYNGSAIEIVG